MYNTQYDDDIIDTIEEVLREEYNVCHNYGEVSNTTIEEFKAKITEKTMGKLNDTLKSKLLGANAYKIDNTIYILPNPRNSTIVFRISR